MAIEIVDLPIKNGDFYLSLPEGNGKVTNKHEWGYHLPITCT
jgi:hypothetical protein